MRAGPVKIWLVHGSYTGGHASAARSLAEALKEHPEVETEIINTADTSGMPVSTAAERALNGGSWIRRARTWLFEQQFEGNRLLKWASDGAYKLAGHFNDEFLRRVEKEKPDLIVSTQGSTNSLLNGWIESGKLKTPVHSVITDFASHQMWAQDNIAHYYVAFPETQQDLEGFGVESDRISITGIPIKAGFGNRWHAQIERCQIKDSLGLDPDKQTVLMMGGSLGLGSFTETIAALDQLPQDFQMAALVGKNEQARSEVEAMTTVHPTYTEGYTQQMAEWMQAADVVVSRPGGLTSSELLAAGKPMVLPNIEAGLGARNVTRLVESRAAVKADTPEQVASMVGKILSDQEVAASMQEAALTYGRAGAAADIAARLLGAVQRSRRAQPSSVCILRSGL